MYGVEIAGVGIYRFSIYCIIFIDSEPYLVFDRVEVIPVESETPES